jgi:hypothetical protein
LPHLAAKYYGNFMKSTGKQFSIFIFKDAFLDLDGTQKKVSFVIIFTYTKIGSEIMPAWPVWRTCSGRVLSVCEKPNQLKRIIIVDTHNPEPTRTQVANTKMTVRTSSYNFIIQLCKLETQY